MDMKLRPHAHNVFFVNCVKEDPEFLGTEAHLTLQGLFYLVHPLLFLWSMAEDGNVSTALLMPCAHQQGLREIPPPTNLLLPFGVHSTMGCGDCFYSNRIGKAGLSSPSRHPKDCHGDGHVSSDGFSKVRQLCPGVSGLRSLHLGCVWLMDALGSRTHYHREGT